MRDAGDVVVQYRAGASGAVAIDGVSEDPAIDLFVVRHQQLVHFASGISGAKSAADVGDAAEQRRNGAEMAIEYTRSLMCWRVGRHGAALRG